MDLGFINWSILWFVAIFIFAAIEVFTVSLVTIWFVGGSLAAWILSIFGVPPALQIIVFIGVSVALLIYTRPILENLMKGKHVPMNLETLIGAKGVVTQKIEDYEIGEVKLEGKYWSAKSFDGGSINLGEEVEVVRIDGVKLIVR